MTVLSIFFLIIWKSKPQRSYKHNFFVRLSSDLGTEFSLIASDDFQFQHELKVYRSVSENVKKNSLVERTNKTIQERLYRVMNARRSYKWFQFLPEVVAGINNMKRKILFGYSSSEVKHNSDIASIVRQKRMIKHQRSAEQKTGKSRNNTTGSSSNKK